MTGPTKAPRPRCPSEVPPESLLPEPYRGRVFREEYRPPIPGEYWESVDPVEAPYGSRFETIPAGTLFLITDLELVQNDEVHRVEVFVPPPYTPVGRHDSQYVKYLFVDFIRFTRPAGVDGRAVRQQELSGYLAEQTEVIGELGEGIRSAAALATCIDAALPSPDGPRDRTEQHFQVLDERQQDVENALRGEMIESLQEKSGALAKSAELCAAEIAAQAVAVTHAPKLLIKRIEKGLRRFSSYAGRDVEIERIVEGEDGGIEGTLTVFQSARYMDEEYIVHLKEGGADYRHWPDFMAELAADPEKVARILPVEHCLCLMRYRRKEKIYNPAGTLAAFYENLEANKPNFAGFLLYRRGGSVWRIDSPVTKTEITTLFPTERQLKKPFERFGDQVRRDSHHYKKSFDEYEALLETYQRLLLVIAGLQDREQLFPGLPNGPDLLNSGDNPECFRWVHDAEAALVDGRDTIIGWIEKNQRHYLMSGVRVLCDWGNLITHRTLSRSGSRSRRRFVASDRYDVRIAHREGNQFYVEAPFGVVEGSEAERVYLTRWTDTGNEYRSAGLGFVILDSVALEDVEFYMQSWRARRSYIAYIDTFLELRNVLKADLTEQKPFRDAVRILVPGPRESFDSTFRESVRQWRASRRGRQLPAPGDADFDEEAERIRKIAATTLAYRSSEGRPAALVQADPRAFAFATTGRNRFVSYSPDPKSGRGLMPPLFARRKQWIERKSGKLWLERERVDRFSNPLPAAESLVWVQPDTPDSWASKDNERVESLTPSQFNKLADKLQDNALAKLALGQCDRYDVEDRFEAWVRSITHHFNQASWYHYNLTGSTALIPLASRWIAEPYHNEHEAPGRLIVWYVLARYVDLLYQGAGGTDGMLDILYKGPYSSRQRYGVEKLLKNSSHHAPTKPKYLIGQCRAAVLRWKSSRPGAGFVYPGERPDTVYGSRDLAEWTKGGESGTVADLLDSKVSRKYYKQEPDRAYDCDLGLSLMRETLGI